MVLVPLLVLRTVKNAGPGPYGLDASYYVQLARHVAAGEGLVTTVSLYHAGYVLPARSTTHPLWPLVLGYTARITGLIEAATLLPRLCYVAVLLLLLALTRHIASHIEGPSRGWSEYAPYLVTALFGLNHAFFAITTHPYREGITYAAGLLALLLLKPLAMRPSLMLAVVAGVAAGVAFLGRLEFAAIGVASIVAMAWCRLSLRYAASYLAAAALSVAPWIVWLGYVPSMGRFFIWRRIPQVTIPGPVEHSLSVSERLVDWLGGAAVMFRIGSRFSYTSSFGVAALLVPVGIIVALIAKSRGSRVIPHDLVVRATWLTGVFTFLAVFFYRGVYIEYFFGWRQGLTLIFLLIVLLPFLLSYRSRTLRVVTLAAVAASLAFGSVRITEFIREPNLAYSPAETEMLASLDGSNRVLTRNAQVLGMLSEAHFYSTSCSSSPLTTLAYLNDLSVDRVVVYEGETGCRFLQGLGGELRVLRTFGREGRRIFLLGRQES